MSPLAEARRELLVPGALISTLQLAGLIGLQWFLPIALSLACSGLGALVVHTTTVERAAAVHTDLRYQLSAYLDVVTMLLALELIDRAELVRKTAPGRASFTLRVRPTAPLRK